MSPMMRATSVLPTPGGPVNTMCWLTAPTSMPSARRRASTSTRAATVFTCSLTGASPITASRRAMTFRAGSMSTAPPAWRPRAAAMSGARAG